MVDLGNARPWIPFLLSGGVFGGFVVWLPNEWCVFCLGWPALALAWLGLVHTWMAQAALTAAWCWGLLYYSRRFSWKRVAAASLVVSLAYCGAAWWFLQNPPARLPLVTPFDASIKDRETYIEAFKSGYQDGIMGMYRTYCFMEPVRTKGLEDGAESGCAVWCQAFGSLHEVIRSGYELDDQIRTTARACVSRL